MSKSLARKMINAFVRENDGRAPVLKSCVFAVWSCCNQASLQEAGRVNTYQRDQVSEGQLDLNLHLVFRMNHWTNILVVAFE